MLQKRVSGGAMRSTQQNPITFNTLKICLSLAFYMLINITNINAQWLNFGDGSDGSLTVNSGVTTTINQVQTNVTSIANTRDQVTVASTTGFANGMRVMVVDFSLAGRNYNLAKITSISGSNINLDANWKLNSLITGVQGSTTQILQVMQYTDVTINGTLDAPAWNAMNGH